MTIQGRPINQYSAIQFLFETEFDKLQKFIKYQSDIINLQNDDLKKEFSEYTKDNILTDDWVDYIAITEEFPFIFYNSVLFTSYSFFEIALRKFTQVVKEEFIIKLSPSDLKGNGVEIYKNYLEKVLNTDLSSLNDKWAKIMEVKKIRNFLIHGSNENNKLNEIKSIVNKNSKYLKLKPETKDLYIIDPIYIYEFLKISEEYLNGIIAIILKNKIVSELPE